MKSFAILMTTTLLAAAAYATEVYITYDKEGNRIFSDTPSDNAVRHTIRPIQTIPALEVEPSQPEEKQDSKQKGYSLVKIQTPLNDSSIPSGQAGNVMVSAKIVPNLQGGHMATLRLDGQVVGKGKSNVWQLNGLNRGTHQLTLSIEDFEGKLVKSASPVTFHVQRASVRR